MHAALAAAVEAVVGQDLTGLWPDQLQAHISAVAPLVQRLSGFVSLAVGELAASTGGKVATDDGGSRSVVGWVAETTRTGPAAAGSAVRTALVLQQHLPRVAQAVVDVLCRRHHVLWHLGRITSGDLHLPWLTVRGGDPPPRRRAAD